jgi:signal transduction histidine kinase
VKLEELIEDAVQMNDAGLRRHGVRIVRQFAQDVPMLELEKHKVLQILVNLIRNAKAACKESAKADCHITLSLSCDERCARISVTDNGVGIPKENVTRIFGLGFTTKKDGHGFGLHGGAIAAKELGGALLVHSDGAGLGATFTLELPIKSSGSTTSASANGQLAVA